MTAEVAPVSPPMDRSRLTVVVVCYLIFVVLGMPDGMIAVAFPAMRTEFNLGLEAFGTIFVATTIGFLASSFFVGRMLNRFHTAAFLIAACLLRTAGIAGYALAPGW